MVKGLELGDIKPPSNTEVPLDVFHYQGSYTKPPCNENLFWYVNKNYLSIHTKTLIILKQSYLINKNTFPE
jgi:carbonic anhydrase